MGIILSVLTAPLRFWFGALSWVTESWIYVLFCVVTAAMLLMSSALSLLVFVEEVVIVFLLLPWIPSFRIGQIISFLKRLGFPGKLIFLVYAAYLLVLLVIDLIALEMKYLEVGENLQTSFAEFRANLFTSLKLFLVVHRLLSLLGNEASLRGKYRALCRKMSVQEGEVFDEEFRNDDSELDSLKEELQRVKQELETVRSAYEELHDLHESKRSSRSESWQDNGVPD